MTDPAPPDPRAAAIGAADTTAPAAPRRALVLGGGGVTGIAWELGVLDVVVGAGLDLLDADRIIGTSAGAAVAAQITSPTPLADLVAAQLDASAAAKELAVAFDLDAMVEIFELMTDQTRETEERCARVGALALAADTVPEEVRLAIIASRLPEHDWPARPLEITAVDAHSGVFVVFDRASGVPLVDAVAASCAVPGVWPPVTIDGRRYIDGGVRSTTNADLAGDCSAAVLLSPLSPSMTAHARVEAKQLRDGGAAVFLLEADDRALEEMGPNPLDPAMRAPAVAAGRRQGLAALESFRAVWT